MSSKKRRYSGLFRKYFVITISIILASFVFIGGALLLLVSKLWMDEKLELLSENTVNVADNARDVLQSDYLGQSGRASVILICNTLLQTSNAVNADIFITGLDGHVAYCKDVLQSDMALYTGNCIVHNKYQIPDDILKSVLSGQKYSTAGDMNGMLGDIHFIVGVPLQVDGQTVGAVFSTQPIVNGLTPYIAAIFKMFFIASLFAFTIAFICVYFVSYRLTKPPARDVRRNNSVCERRLLKEDNRQALQALRRERDRRAGGRLQHNGSGAGDARNVTPQLRCERVA